MVWDREDGRTTVKSYWILDVNQELESSNPKGFSCQWIPRQKRAEAERLHPSYTLWVGMDMTERPTQRISKKWMVWDREDGRTTVESYCILDVNQELESSNPQRIF